MNIPPKYSVEIRRLDEDGKIAVRLASITVHGDAALARLLHGYAESIEDELPARQYDSDPPIIVRPDWFEKAMANAVKVREMEDRARWVCENHFSLQCDAGAAYILTGHSTHKEKLS